MVVRGSGLILMRLRFRQILAWASVSALIATGLWFAPALPAEPGQTAKSATSRARVVRKRANPAPLTRAEQGRRIPGGGATGGVTPGVLDGQDDRSRSADERREPRQHQMHRAASFDGDLRALPQTQRVRKRERPEREGPSITPVP